MSIPSHFHSMDLRSCLVHGTTPFVCGMHGQVMALEAAQGTFQVSQFCRIFVRRISTIWLAGWFECWEVILGSIVAENRFMFPQKHDITRCTLLDVKLFVHGMAWEGYRTVWILVYRKSFFSPSSAFKICYMYSVALDVPTVIATFTGLWYHWNIITICASCGINKP